MVHGSSEYFVERDRCARRVSLLALGLALAGIVGLPLSQVSGCRAVRIDTARLGFEGRNQYVRRIVLESHRGPSAVLSDLGKVQAQSARGGETTPKAGQTGKPMVKMQVREDGEGERSYSIRGVANYGTVPVVRSEDLVIAQMVRPKYPEPLLDKNIEGKVTLQALVDTVGQVIQVEVLSSTGETLFETAAQEAVMQCRFRPYRREGEVSQVYAVFRFSFRIY